MSGSGSQFRLREILILLLNLHFFFFARILSSNITDIAMAQFLSVFLPDYSGIGQVSQIHCTLKHMVNALSGP